MEQLIAVATPFRYRGYYYDNETSLYYLNSRYYDSANARFINADGYVSTGQGFNGNNMYAYCGNNPVIRIDINGQSWEFLDVVSGVIEDVCNSVEIQFGFGLGFGLMFNDLIGFEFGMDDTIFIDDGEVTMGKVATNVISIFGFDIGGTHVHKTSGNSPDVHAHLILFNMFEDYDYTLSCEKCQHYSNTFGEDFSEKDVVFAFSNSAHFLIGGNMSVGINITELIENLSK